MSLTGALEAALTPYDVEPQASMRTVAGEMTQNIMPVVSS